MSKPIRSPACGCVVATTGNRYDEKPSRLRYGQETVTTTNKCPLRNSHHAITHHSKEILTRQGEVVGHLEWNEGSFSRYITVPSKDCVMHFPGKDVYVKGDGWDFAQFRHSEDKGFWGQVCPLLKSVDPEGHKGGGQ